MSYFSLNLKMRGREFEISVPQDFSFYRFGNRIDMHICAVCPEGVAITTQNQFNRMRNKKPVKKFLAHSTVFNYYSFAIPQLNQADYWDGDGSHSE